MLNPRNKRDRLNYGELLASPEGYVLTKAVGTTYSLDLYALLAIPVAMFYAKSMEGDFQQNRYDVLDAIRQSKDKVDLFCQRGKIKVPLKYSNLLAFMEDCIEEVTPYIENSSFHPKIWVLRFEKGKEQLFRLIVLSRNLTFDRSWDIAYFADGVPATLNSESKKLCDYLSYFYSNTKRKIDTTFIKNLSNVEFKNADGFTDFQLFPILGFEGKIKKHPNPLTEVTYEEMLVISPFVDETTLKLLKKNNKKIALFSREEELDKLAENNLEGIDCYCMNSLIVNGEDYLDSENNEALSQNIHAKLFIGQYGEISDWYMGSANCTSPAFERNAEILIKIKSKLPQYTIEAVKNTLLDVNYNFFTKYDRSIVDNNSDDSLKKVIRAFSYQLTKVNFKGTVKEREEGENYNLSIKADLKSLKEDRFVIKVNLIHREDVIDLKCGIENTIEFENISLLNLSKYLILTIYEGKEKLDSLLVKMDLTIPEEREDIIFNELINSKQKFFQYLQFILNPDKNSGDLEILQNSSLNGNNESESLQHLLGVNNSIYESLMIAASRSPRKLKEIDGIITRLQKLNSEIVADFMPIWEAFKEFAHD